MEVVRGWGGVEGEGRAEGRGETVAFRTGTRLLRSLVSFAGRYSIVLILRCRSTGQIEY